jgi:hypothetical protein
MKPCGNSSLSQIPYIGREDSLQKVCSFGGQTARQTDTFIRFPLVSPQQRNNLFD